MLPKTSIHLFKDMSRIAYATLRIGRSTAWGVVTTLVAAGALGDIVSGSEIWFGPVYLFILCVATWLLGWGIGHGIGIFCMLLSFIINGAALYPFASSIVSLDLLLRFVAMSVILSAIAAVRGAYMREWWLARIEPMTGALNRQAFFEFGELMCSGREWRLMLFADLNGFKEINDNLGHAVGDQCLREFARAVRGSIRRDDIFARMGGDEFVVFMAVKERKAGNAVAARLHRVMNDIQCANGVALRCSVGALIIPPGDATLDALVRHADRLMYRSKVAGGQLESGEASPLVSPAIASGARRKPRPTILADAPTPKYPYERRAALPRS